MILYKPYRGGAGPDFEQSMNNTLCLGLITGLPVEITTAMNDDDIPEIGVNHNGNWIAYDRWGFCDSNGDLDQASLEDTVWFIQTGEGKINAGPRGGIGV